MNFVFWIGKRLSMLKQIYSVYSYFFVIPVYYKHRQNKGVLEGEVGDG